jgi:hypothetical protein
MAEWYVDIEVFDLRLGCGPVHDVDPDHDNRFQQPLLYPEISDGGAIAGEWPEHDRCFSCSSACRASDCAGRQDSWNGSCVSAA